MKKLISAATSLCMAASMVGYVAPAVVGAADATKGFAIKTYDINNPSSASGKSTITLDKTKDFADGDAVIPCAVYYSEATDNSTGSLLVSLTTDSKDIKMKLHDPAQDYTAEEKSYTLGGVSFDTSCYISFAGFCKNKRSGYLSAGKYVFGEAESQLAANTENYFIGCSWMNNGEDYHWAGESSDSYPFYVFDVKVPKTIKEGSYKITYCRYNTDATGANDNPAPMVESGGERYTAEAGNLKLEELTIKVTNGDEPIETTSTSTTQKTTTTTKVSGTTTTTTKVTDVPVAQKDVNFKFVDENGNSTVELPSGKGGTVAVDVQIDAGTNPISALDVQFKTTPGIKISEIYKSNNAFKGISVSSNLAELRASYATLDGDKPLTAKNGQAAFMLDVDVPADTPDGIYYVDFADQCKIFKDNTSFNYETSSQPLKIVVGNPTPTQTTTQKTTTTKVSGTTTAPIPVDADVNFAFVDENGKDTVELPSGKGGTVAVDVNINAGTNPISALDVQFKTTAGIKISEIYKSNNAFKGISVSSNLAELRASYATLDGDKPLTAKNGQAAFMLDVEVPADTPDGIYYVDFADQCKIFKDNTSFNYKTSSKPLKIVVGTPTPTETTTQKTTTAKPTGTTVTTSTPVLAGDVNFKFVDENGNSNVIVDPTKGATIPVDVQIEAGTNPISALDVQFKTTAGIKISEIYKSNNAFKGISVSSNLAELRASYATLDGDKPLTAKNGQAAFMLDVEVPAGTPEGTYTVGFDSQCKIFKDNTSFNYNTDFTPLTIVVKKPGTESSVTTASATTTAKPTGTTVTTTTPVLDGDVNFKFVDEDGNSVVKVKKGEAKTIGVDVQIEAGTNPISALDVQFKTSDGVKISEIYKSNNAFKGISVSSNLAELRASYATLDGDKPLTAKNGQAAFMLDVEVPATLAAGTYTVGFDSQCKIFKDNTSFNYKTAFTPLTIIVEDPTVTTESTTTTEKTTSTTTSTETSTTTKKTTTTTVSDTTTTVTTTTTTPQPETKLDVTMWGDTNCDGTVNVADVVVLNRLLNEPTYVVKHPVTKADVTAQGKVNADVVDPQNKEGKGIDPTKVKLTGADSEAIAMYILEKGNIPQ